MSDDVIRLKNNQATRDRRLDRVVQFDPRSKAFPIRALIPKAAKPRSFTWSCAVQLDQGQEGACTGFGVAHEGAARPVCVPGVTNEVAQGIYQRARVLDEWPGEDYEGSSVIAAVKAAQEKGWYPGGYRWGFSLDDSVLALGLHGPVIIGVNWREGMMNTDSDGFIHSTGEVVGGHCTLIRGVNIKKRYALGRNSWGPGWGINGDFKISLDDLEDRLHDQGEACIPISRAIGILSTSGH